MVFSLQFIRLFFPSDSTALQVCFRSFLVYGEGIKTDARMGDVQKCFYVEEGRERAAEDGQGGCLGKGVDREGGGCVDFGGDVGCPTPPLPSQSVDISLLFPFPTY